jgi:hypothetical protein
MRSAVMLLCGLLTALGYAGRIDAQAATASGKAEAVAPGWTITTDLPKGWNKDCCTYAAAIGVNLVLYQGEWTGKPERVMVLNVWPSKLPALSAELQDDRQHYLKSDPHGVAADFSMADPHGIGCQGVLYHGSDHVDDMVVFCDPGKQSGIRYSWSMTLSASDPNRQALINTFKQVVQHSAYVSHLQPSAPTHPTAHQ